MKTTPRICRIYQRFSASQQDLVRQDLLRLHAEAEDYVVAEIYSEKEVGMYEDRPELQRMLSDINASEVIIVEHLDRITKLPIENAEALVAAIRAKGAKLSIPGLLDLPMLGEEFTDIATASMQEMLLKVALYQCVTDYETRRVRQREGIQVAKEKGVYKGRKPNTIVNEKILELRRAGFTIANIASSLQVSESQVKQILKKASSLDA
jgi:DNA invertase Pin-like site-specific DNA recombinase